tara:strand:+ start:1649 stop:2035 length:387 start_codon:yes stop_codon:yes gene_type:complete
MNKEINLPQKVEILRTFKHLGVVEVTSKTQKKNGTRRFRMPFKLDGRENVEFAVYKSGYVRKTKGFIYACYQINKTRKSCQRYHKVLSGPHQGYYWKFADGRDRILIETETERLQYLLDFLVRNYFKA